MEESTDSTLPRSLHFYFLAQDIRIEVWTCFLCSVICQINKIIHIMEPIIFYLVISINFFSVFKISSSILRVYICWYIVDLLFTLWCFRRSNQWTYNFFGFCIFLFCDLHVAFLFFSGWLFWSLKFDLFNRFQFLEFIVLILMIWLSNVNWCFVFNDLFTISHQLSSV
jgi:hypothetical protein